jgi:transketolase
MLRRFEGHGWHVQQVADANDLESVSAALEAARSTGDRPSLVAVRSNIAYGAPTKQDSSGAHGSPLGDEEIRGAKAAYGWPIGETFLVPEATRERYAREMKRGRQSHDTWQGLFSAWSEAEPELAAEWRRRMAGELPEGWTASLPSDPADGKGMATRAASGKVLNAIEGVLPELLGGSADLSPSCKTTISSSGSVTAATPGERNLHFGVREHGMGAMLNGMSLHGGLRPYGATFLVFSDYMRPAIRLAALMEQPTIFIFTHDSIWVGEDGPTHQPVEHIAALRAIPNLVVIRPADANETAAAWKEAVNRRSGPTALVLSRHGLPVLEGTDTLAPEGLARGAYVLVEADGGDADLLLVASGSEVCLAVEAARSLREHDLAVRVVSMPSWELFDAQPEAYRQEVLPSGPAKLAVEAGITRGWRDYVGNNGSVIGIDRFGASAPGREVASHFGLTTEKVIEKALELTEIGKRGER